MPEHGSDWELAVRAGRFGPARGDQAWDPMGSEPRQAGRASAAIPICLALVLTAADDKGGEEGEVKKWVQLGRKGSWLL